MKATSKFMSAASAAALSASLVLTASAALQVATVTQVQAAVVNSVSVRGNQRVDAETIRSYINFKPGKNYGPGEIDEAVKRLFSTGLFSDIRINQSGSTLIVEVDELQVVNQVLIQGNKKIKDDVLIGRIQTRPRAPYQASQVEADADTIRESYRRIGRSDAIVTTQIMDLGENRVNVVFEINEGGRTKIANVEFVGNQAFSDGRLRDVISTKRSNVLSFLMRDDVYDQDRLRADEEALRRYYYNRGYADFQVISSSATLDDTKNEYTVSFTIEEGERYTFGDISLESSIPGVDADRLKGDIKSRQGKVYSAKDVEDTIIKLTENVAGSGYAFAEVTPRGDRDFTNRTISVTYTIDQGPRTYVQRIEIRGNTTTRDYVIRREFDVAEGDAFNQVLIQRAKRRLEDLDFFESVDISTQPGTEADQVVVIVDVKEKSTGEFSIGGGYATGGDNPGPTMEISVTQRNFLGRGQYIRIGAGGGKNSRDYTLSFTEPYFLGSRISAGFDIFRNTRELTFYSSESTGGTIRFGLPITDALSAQLAYNYVQEKYKYTTKANTAPNVCPGVGTCPVPIATQQAIANSPWIKSSVSGTLTYNTIDNMKDPRNGIYATLTGEYAGLGGDANYFKLTARGQYFKTLNEEMGLVGVVSAGGGHIFQVGNSKLRQFDLFQNSDRIIRGFSYNGIGPYDPTAGIGKEERHVGGLTYLNASAEAQFPLPAFPESFGLRGAVFGDVATLYGVPNDPDYAGLSNVGSAWRASVGASILWQSPFGPLRIDYAVPVRKLKGDNVQNLNFGISGRF